MAGAGTSIDWPTVAIVLSLIAQFVWPFIWYIWKEHKKKVDELEKKANAAAPATAIDQIRLEISARDEKWRDVHRSEMRLSEERHTIAIQRMEDKHQSDFQGLRKDINGMAETIRREMADQARANREDIISRVELMGQMFESQMALIVAKL